MTAALWDLVLIEGSRALFASFLALLRLYLPRAPEDEAASALLGSGVAPEEIFRRLVYRGVRDDPAMVLQWTAEFLPAIPADLVDHFRWVYTDVSASPEGHA